MKLSKFTHAVTNGKVSFFLWFSNIPFYICFPGGSDGKNLPAMRNTCVRYLGWEDPLEEDVVTHSSIPAWRISMDKDAWWATVHGIAKSRT